MLDESQKAKLVAWAEWKLAHDEEAEMPRGINALDWWSLRSFSTSAMPFPTFDRDEPYTFGEDHG